MASTWGGGTPAPAEVERELQRALSQARKNKAAMVAALNASATGAGDAADSASIKQGMAVAQQQWVDPNARLDSMLSEMVAATKSFRAPTLRRKATQRVSVPPATAVQQPPSSAGATPTEAAPNVGSVDSAWEVVPHPGPDSTAADAQQRAGGAPAATAAHPEPSRAASGPAAGSEGQDIEYYGAEYDDMYEYVYEEEEEGEGEGDADSQGAGGQGLEQVLALRLQLSDLDQENAKLRQQLDQQKRLMEQLQASLLLGAPSGAQVAATPAPDDAHTTTVPVHERSTGGGDEGGPSERPAHAPASLSPASTTPGAPPTLDVSTVNNLSEHSDDTTQGFDALAATPKQPSPRLVSTPVPAPSSTSLHPPSPAPAAPAAQQPVLMAGLGAATVAGPVSGSSTFSLGPDVDILDGLGLAGSRAAGAHPTDQPPQVPVPAPLPAPAASPTGSATPLVPKLPPPPAPLTRAAPITPAARRPSEGELEAIRAVQEYETVGSGARAGLTGPPSGAVASKERYPHLHSAPVSYPFVAARSSEPPPASPAQPWNAYPAVSPAGKGAWPSPPSGVWTGGPAAQQHLTAHYQPAGWAGSAGSAQPQGWGSGSWAPPAAHELQGGYAPLASGPPPPAFPAYPPISGSGAGLGLAQRHSAALPPEGWACQVCTYMHEGKEATYLRCAMCGALK